MYEIIPKTIFFPPAQKQAEQSTHPKYVCILWTVRQSAKTLFRQTTKSRKRIFVCFLFDLRLIQTYVFRKYFLYAWLLP